MRTLLVPAFLLLSACAEEYTLPKEACSSSVSGQNLNSIAAQDALLRTNCYRRFVGLPKARLDASLSDSADSHSEYLVLNYDAGLDASATQEDPNQEGFTGHDGEDRAEAHGFEFPDSSYGMLSLTISKLVPEMPSFAVADFTINNPVLRQYALYPSMYATGYGESGDWAVINYVYNWPPAVHVGAPIVYPADGQLEVPTSQVAFYDLPNSQSPVIRGGFRYGYPITVMVGSGDTTTAIGGADPLEMSLLDYSLNGPDGLVDAAVISPATAPERLINTIIVWPLEELEPGAQYRFEGTVGWVSGPKDFVVLFTTADEAAE